MINVYFWIAPNRQRGTRREGQGDSARILRGRTNSSLKICEYHRTTKIIAMVDRDGPSDQSIAVFASGALLLYLAEKRHCQFSRRMSAGALTLSSGAGSRWRVSARSSVRRGRPPGRRLRSRRLEPVGLSVAAHPSLARREPRGLLAPEAL